MSNDFTKCPKGIEGPVHLTGSSPELGEFKIRIVDGKNILWSNSTFPVDLQQVHLTNQSAVAHKATHLNIILEGPSFLVAKSALVANGELKVKKTVQFS
jgi:hypothetical protein